MKHCNDTTGNGTRDLSAYGAVPQPSAPPLIAPLYWPKGVLRTAAVRPTNCSISEPEAKYRQHKALLFTFIVKPFHPQHNRLRLKDMI